MRFQNALERPGDFAPRESRVDHLPRILRHEQAFIAIVQQVDALRGEILRSVGQATRCRWIQSQTLGADACRDDGNACRH